MLIACSTRLGQTPRYFQASLAIAACDKHCYLTIQNTVPKGFKARSTNTMSSSALRDANEWMPYLNHTSHQGPFFDDRLLYSQRLHEHEKRLFSDANPVIEVLLYQRTEENGR